MIEAVSQPLWLTPFSNETRHSGFLQDLINFFPTPAMCAHRPPTHANGLTRALTASKYSPFHCRDVVSPCLRGPRYFLPEHLDVSKVDETVTWQGRLFRPTIIGKEPEEPRTHLSRASSRSSIRGLMCWFSSAWHRNTFRCIFEKLSGPKKLKNIAFVRDFEHFDNEIEGLGRH